MIGGGGTGGGKGAWRVSGRQLGSRTLALSLRFPNGSDKAQYRAVRRSAPQYAA